MARKRKDDLELVIERTLVPGMFVGYRNNSAFVEDVDAVRAEIALLIKSGEAMRAVALLETFIAGCYEKSEEIDDSDGTFGQFVEELFCDWIRPRQASKADPAETAGMLLSWMEADDYGYCHVLEKEAVKVFNRVGLAAFEQAVRGWSDGTEKDYSHGRQVGILKTIHEARRDVDAYSALCETEGEFAPADCEKLAEMCLKLRRREDALAWVERGLEQDKRGRWPNRSAWGLPDLRRQILQKLGRREEALASAWEDYQRAPSVYRYDDLMKFVAKGERSGWHAKALAALEGTSLSPHIDLLVHTKEWERLAAVVESVAREEFMAVSHYATEPAAEGIEKSYPLLAAKLHVAMALRILDAKKSKYYDAALRNLGRARELMLKEGQSDGWETIAREVRQVHGRKSAFMPGLKRLAEGRSVTAPSFLDRARKRWLQRAGRGRDRS